MGWDVLNRRYDFTKPRDKYKILEPYGPNVATAEGSTYRFHVRITAPPFSDGSGVNELVWKETQRQTQLLMQDWTENQPENIGEDVNALTLAVISLAGFGKRLESVKDQTQDIPPGYRLSFLRAISDTTAYMLAILVFPSWLLELTPYAKASLAKKQLEKYMYAMIRQAKQRIESVVQAAHDESEDRSTKEPAQSPRRGFNEDEVAGNLFIYLLAGYETTANAIVYALVVLALRPDIQAKVVEEVDRVYAEAAADGRSALTYKDDFAKLAYSYGFMYETFRLYPGVTLITKICRQAQHVQVSDESGGSARDVILPAECRVYLSCPGVHYNPKYWPEPQQLDPDRWCTATLLRQLEVSFAPGVDAEKVRRDLNRKSAGKITLAPVEEFRLALRKREAFTT
ncbi:cytochrome p450 [Hirsutella rhossiliensis]|uniref:Cytochrome p450 domain-containing protein n=1 Tax=Hirsutella rhossiliensis TaxID=111463 RepID=A0A9P8N5F5_9HYPO|nr:cytochrome p450 domain-containing protein [Hirsutella rhossiliensis]KAH0968828.1 cytochrome p450 domain-containing protein [Hirsutella rhossiliensis]